MKKKRNLAILNLAEFWLPPIVWSILIFTLSSFPTGRALSIDWQDFIVKKTVHIFEYGVLSCLWYRALKNKGLKKINAGIYAIVISIIYGITDEIHQSLVPGREPRVRDVFFDTIGATVVIYLIWKYLPKAPKKLKIWAESFQLL